MEKVTLDVNVPQPLIQSQKTENITSNTTTLIAPDSGYDGLSSVRVITNIPNETTSLEVTSNGTYQPVSPYIGYNFVSVQVPQQLLETLTNKRLQTNDVYSISSLMNDSTKDGITKNSTIIVDVPQPDITQITNYSITTNGGQTIPIPSGYDAVDSIYVNVNVPPIYLKSNQSVVSNGTYALIDNDSDPTDVEIEPYTRGTGTNLGTFVVDVPTYSIESSKSATAHSDGSLSYVTTVSPSSGYDGIAQALVITSNYTYTCNIAAETSSSTDSSNSYVNRYINGYASPTSGNTSGLQTITYVSMKSNSTYSGIHRVNIRAKIQSMNITANGTYYPYDSSTIIKTITVNVPTSSLITFDRVTVSSTIILLSNFTNYSSGGTINTAGYSTTVLIRKNTSNYEVGVYKNRNSYNQSHTFTGNFYAYTFSYNNNVMLGNSGDNNLVELPGNPTGNNSYVYSYFNYSYFDFSNIS